MWLNNQLYKMLFKNKITEKYVETEKKTVLLEIGDPSPLANAFGIDITKILSFKYLEEPKFCFFGHYPSFAGGSLGPRQPEPLTTRTSSEIALKSYTSIPTQLFSSF